MKPGTTNGEARATLDGCFRHLAALAAVLTLYGCASTSGVRQCTRSLPQGSYEVIEFATLENKGIWALLNNHRPSGQPPAFEDWQLTRPKYGVPPER